MTSFLYQGVSWEAIEGILLFIIEDDSNRYRCYSDSKNFSELVTHVYHMHGSFRDLPIVCYSNEEYCMWNNVEKHWFKSRPLRHALSFKEIRSAIFEYFVDDEMQKEQQYLS